MSTAANIVESFMLPEQSDLASSPWLADTVVFEKQKTVPWLAALRATGAEQFAQSGLPTPAWEGWQHTNVRSLSNMQFRYSTDAIKFDAKKLPAALLDDSDRIVIVNGQYQQHLSTAPDSVMVMSLMDAIDKKIEGLERHLVTAGDLHASPFKSLNTAYVRDGMMLKVKDGIDAKRPLEILFYNIGSTENHPAIYPRMLYWIGENSGLTIMERHIGEGIYFSNSYTGIVQESASRLKIYKFEEESEAAFHFSFSAIQQQKNSSFEGFGYATGGKVAREEYQNDLIDSGISSNISGVCLLKNQQNHDFTILINHFEPNGKSVQYFKGVVDDQARAVFQGKIHVRRSAQKTDGNQFNHALLLSGQAEASFKPELEIYADDVKCSHGATSGRIDDSALFYLQSRGITEAGAKALLIQSFMNEALEQVSFAPAKEIYLERIRAWLAN